MKRSYYTDQSRGLVRDYNLQIGEDYAIQIREIIRDVLKKFRRVSCRLKLKLTFKKATGETVDHWFTLEKSNEISSDEDLDNVIKGMVLEMNRKVESFEDRGSGWIFENFNQVVLCVVKHNPIRGSSTYRDIPAAIRSKHAVVNVQNKTDNRCFEWALLAALYPATDHPQRVSNYAAHVGELNFDRIEMPARLEKKTFEYYLEDNPGKRRKQAFQTPKIRFILGQHLNVFTYDANNGVLPYFTDPTDPQNAIDLLFLPSEDEEYEGGGKLGHYAWIRNLNRLLSLEVSKHKERKEICKRCCSHFSSGERESNPQNFIVFLSL